MGIKANFNMDSIRNYAYLKKDEFVASSLEAFQLACMKMVERAKQTNTYQDQSSALRSSIGCVLYHNGSEVYNYFLAEKGEGGVDGAKKGLEYARSIAENAGNKPIVAVVVAGMEYAVYVEAGHHIKKKDGTTVYVQPKDVLTGSTYQFADDLKESFENVKNAFSDHIIEKFGL